MILNLTHSIEQAYIKVIHAHAHGLGGVINTERIQPNTRRLIELVLKAILHEKNKRSEGGRFNTHDFGIHAAVAGFFGDVGAAIEINLLFVVVNAGQHFGQHHDIAFGGGRVLALSNGVA